MLIQNKIVKNAGWIIACKIAQSVIALVIGMITARYLGPSNFGVVNYAASLVAFLTPIMQLGLNNILVQEIIANPRQEGLVLGSSLVLSFFSAIACMFGLFITVSFLHMGETETICVCCLYSTILLFQSAELIQYWFQAKYMSKYTSIATFVAYIGVVFYKIYIIVSGKSVYWFAISNSFDYVIIAILYLLLYIRKGGGRLSFSLNMSKKMISQSHYYIVSSLMVVAFIQTDKLMIKNFLGNAEIGFYSAALVCATMTSFVFNAIIDSFRPLILEKKMKKDPSYEKNLSALYGFVFYLAVAQAIFVTVFASWIVKILYGNLYEVSTAVLQIAIWFTVFSYMGGVRTIWILAEKKQKYLWILNLSGFLINVLLNLFFIPVWGICGAAVASCITQFFTNFLIGYFLRPLASNNMLILRGLSPIFLKDAIKGLKK